MTRLLPRHWPLFASLVFLAILLIAVVHAAYTAADGHLVYPLDDAYIHMAIAKNVARHGVWGATRHGFSTAGSSLVWPLALAGIDRVAGLDDRTPLVLNVIAAVVLLWLAYATLRRHVQRPAVIAATLCLVVWATPLAALVWIGMEHTLACIATLALAASAARAVAEPRDRLASSLVVCGASLLAIATRYDAGSVLVVVVALLVFARRIGLAAAALVSGIAPAAVFAIVAWRHGWPIVPSAVLVKHRLADADLSAWSGLRSVAAGGIEALVSEPALFVLLLIALVLLAWSAHDGRGDVERRSLLLTFAVATFLHAEFGRFGAYRYEAYLVTLGIVACAASIERFLTEVGVSFSTRRAAAALCGMLLLFPLMIRGYRGARDVVAFTRDMFRHEYQVGRLFQRLPPAGPVLIGEIGTTAYYSDVTIVDPAGLATPEFLEAERAHSAEPELLARVARSYGARIAVWRRPVGGGVPWLCVGVWDDGSERAADRVRFYAADEEAARTLGRALAAFDQDRRTPALHLNDLATRECAEPPGE